jgi:hypothetical protein
MKEFESFPIGNSEPLRGIVYKSPSNHCREQGSPTTNRGTCGDMIGAAQEKRWGESILHSKDDRNGFGIWL